MQAFQHDVNEKLVLEYLSTYTLSREGITTKLRGDKPPKFMSNRRLGGHGHTEGR